MKKRISINFCGGCNPQIDRGKLASKVRTVLETSGYEVCYNNLNADFIIYLSGCTANCALKYSHSNCPHVVVAATTLDTAAVKEEMLATQILTKVETFFE